MQRALSIIVIPLLTIPIPIRAFCSRTHSFAYIGHPLMDANDHQCSSVYYSSGFLTWLDFKTNCTTVYVQVLAPITSLNICIQAGNNMNIALAKTADYVKLAAIIGGVIFLAVVATHMLYRWKKQCPYDPVSSPENPMGCVGPVIPTSMTPEKISAVAMEDPTDNGEVLRSLGGSNLNMAHRKISRPTQETEEKSTEEEEDYAPQPLRASRKVKRKYQSQSDRAPHDVDKSMAHIQGLGSASNSPIGLPGEHFIPNHASYCPICGHHFSRPCGTNVSSGVGNITHVTISGIGSKNSVDIVPRTCTQRTPEINHSEDCGTCLR
ncbi:hypothetical protein BYT27DRAFT_7333990 [Phlegmacium glaucopus]|nr:hypothetical protein BYT27DRAFT_7333990 [Phlegmacium glaucopus]